MFNICELFINESEELVQSSTISQLKLQLKPVDISQPPHPGKNFNQFTLNLCKFIQLIEYFQLFFYCFLGLSVYILLPNFLRIMFFSMIYTLKFWLLTGASLKIALTEMYCRCSCKKHHTPSSSVF